MSRSPEDHLVLASRYIHTGNSGVTLTLRRDLVRVNRAELEVENGAFGAFHTSMLVKGHDTTGMTSIQLRDLALMFLDAADALDKECKIPYTHTVGFSSLLGSENKADLIPEGGGRQLSSAPPSLRRYIPDMLTGIALKADIDLSEFAKVVQTKKDRGAMQEWAGEKPHAKETSKERKLRLERDRELRENRLRKEYVLHTGWDYLLAKRLMDLVSPFFQKTKDDHLNSETVKFTVPESEDSDGFDDVSSDSE